MESEDRQRMVHVMKAGDASFARNRLVLFTCTETWDPVNSLSYSAYGFIYYWHKRFFNCEKNCEGGYTMTVLGDPNASKPNHTGRKYLCNCRLAGLSMNMRLLTNEEVENIKAQIRDKTLAFQNSGPVITSARMYRSHQSSKVFADFLECMSRNIARRSPASDLADKISRLIRKELPLLQPKEVADFMQGLSSTVGISSEDWRPNHEHHDDSE
jgi:hypothetical protein